MVVFADTPVRKILLMVVTAAFLAAVAWWAVTQLHAPRAYEFAGGVETVEGSVIRVRGQFLNVRTKKPLPGDAVTVSVEVVPETRIVRESFRVPSEEERRATGGMFKPDELPKEQSVVPFSQLATDAAQGVLGIRVRAAENVFGKPAFRVKEVLYRTAIFPESTKQ